LSVQPTAVAQQNTAQLEEFKTEIDTLTQKVEELSESLSQSQRENIELQERINLLVNENQQLKGEL
jgi:chromosome segregation ATPase